MQVKVNVMPARAVTEGPVMTTETVSAAPAHPDGVGAHATRVSRLSLFLNWNTGFPNRLTLCIFFSSLSFSKEQHMCFQPLRERRNVCGWWRHVHLHL